MPKLPKKTFLYDRHVRLSGRMVDFHGWFLPVQYEGVLAEHRRCRRSAALFDTSHMGQIRICPPDPDRLNRITTQDAAALSPGRCRYGFLLNERGGILDDTILMRLGERDFLLVVNAGAAVRDLEWIRSHLGEDVVGDQSAEGWSKIDLQGPSSAEVLSPLAEIDLSELGYFHVAGGCVCGCQCILSRTGYTGELGYEIFAPDDGIATIFQGLLADPRVGPAGLGARDSLRLEMCYPLYGQDIDEDTNPVEADLGVFLREEHEHIGAAALKEIAAAGAKRKLVAFVAGTRRRTQHGDDICCEGRIVGKVTSGAFSPTLNVSIGMGYVPPDLSAPGTELTVRAARAEVPVTVAEKPLYKEGTCRTKNV